MKKVKSLGDAVADRIKEAIFSKEKYKPGQQLPIEKELAEEMQVSRTVLREAIKTLEFEGILEIRRGVGTFVSDDFGLGINTEELTYEEIQRTLLYEWYEARLVWEVQSMYLVTKRATDEELAEIISIQAQIAQQIQDNESSFYKLDHLFHKKLTSATHNKILERMVYATGIWDWSYYNMAQRRGPLQERMKENSKEGHNAIVRFLKKRDGEGAAMAMRHHLLQAQEDLK